MRLASRFNLRRRLALEWAAIALIASLIVLFASHWRGTEAFDNLIYDQLSAAVKVKPDSDIVIVTIDDASLSEIGKWPWDRAIHARTIELLQNAKPRSILFDILVSESSPTGGDAALAAAMRQGAPVYVPIHFIAPGSNGRAYDPAPPVDPIRSAAAGIGHVNVEFDSDGIVRRAMLCFSPEATGPRYPHIVELVARRGAKATATYAEDANCDRPVMIPYARRGSFVEIPYAAILNDQIPPQMLRGKDVIIGATAAGMGDSYPVPLTDGGLLSGAEIMANMLGALRHGDFIRPLSGTMSIVFSLVPLWMLLIGLLFWRPRIVLITAILLFILVPAASALLLNAQIWFAPGAALLGLLFVYPLWGWRRLQAMSDFMDRELNDLAENDQIGLPMTSSVGDDMVGRQSTALAGAIDQLHSLRRFVSDILSDLPDPLVVTDLKGTIVVVNDELERRMGRSTVGENLVSAFNQQVTPKVREMITDYFDEQAMGAQDTSRGLRLVSADGRTMILRRSVLHGDNEQPIGHIHYFADISALAKAEAEREEALQLLSHDMRAPQSAIIAMLPDLRDNEARKRIESHARRTMQLAQDFVQIARMGEASFEGTDLLLAELARDVADSLWPLAKERNIIIDVVDHAGDAFIFAEADSLSRALTNLVENAIKHSPAGGRIIVDIARVAGQMLELRVLDDGAGIDEDLLPTLFTRFAKGTEGYSRSKSLGLGLAFVRVVAERHKGSVSASNKPTGGACFSLLLPESIETPPPEDA